MLRRIVSAAAIAALFPAMTAVSAQDAKSTATAADAKSAKTDAGPPPTEAFARLPFIEAPELSPDGTRIAARIAVRGEQRLAIIPVGDVSKIRLINPGDFDLKSWSWVNNDWLLLRADEMQPVVRDCGAGQGSNRLGLRR